MKKLLLLISLGLMMCLSYNSCHSSKKNSQENGQENSQESTRGAVQDSVRGEAQEASPNYSNDQKVLDSIKHAKTEKKKQNRQ